MRLLLILIVFMASCDLKQEDQLLKIGFVTWPGYEPIKYARHMGYLGSDIEVSIFSSANDSMRAFETGLLNSVCVTLDEAIQLQSRGHEFIIYLLSNTSMGADQIIVHKDNTEKEVKDYVFGFEQTAVGEYLLNRFLDFKGIPKDQIKTKYLENYLHYDALVKGKVDAIVTFEPISSKLISEGHKVIFSSSQIPDEIIDVCLVDKTIYAQVKDQIIDIHKVWDKSVNELFKSNKLPKDYLKSRFDLNVDDVKKLVRDLKIPNIEEMKKMICLNSPTEKLSVIATKVENYLLSKGSIQKISKKHNMLMECEEFDKK